MLSIAGGGDCAPVLLLNNVWPFSFTVEGPPKYPSSTPLMPLDNTYLIECLIRTAGDPGPRMSASICPYFVYP
jgi:hypothetical protein